MLPLQMINEGYKASSPGMVFADVRFKGGLYVELNHTNQHVEYIYVNTIATTSYEAFCGMAYDVPARSDPSMDLVINPGTCQPVPGKQQRKQCLGLPIKPSARLPCMITLEGFSFAEASSLQQEQQLLDAQCHAGLMLVQCALAE